MLRHESHRPALPGAGFFVLAVLLSSLALTPVGGGAWVAAQGTSTIHGQVSSEEGLPVPGATVLLEGSGFRAVTGAEGRYRVTGVRTGTYRLQAGAPGFAAMELEVRVPREGEEVRRDVTLSLLPVRLEEVLTLVQRARDSGLRHVLGRQEIERAGSVARALERIPGVFVREFGPGGAREVSIRGGSPDQTLVLWGEERLLTPGGGAFDLSRLAPAAIDSIEVIVRGASSRYGAGALAGVVRIYPAAPFAPGDRELATAAGFGSFGMWEGSARIRLPVGRSSVALTGAARAYERNFGFNENSGGEVWDGSATLRWPAPSLAVSAVVHSSQRGAPGPVTRPTPHAGIGNDRALASAGLDRRVGGWALRGDASVQVSGVDYEDAERPALASESRETSLALRLDGARELSRYRLEGGLEARRHRIAGSEIAGRPIRWELGLHAGARWKAAETSALTLSPGLRADWIRVDPGESAPEKAQRRQDLFLSPSLAALLELGPALTLQAFAGRSFRYPEFQSLFFVSGLGVRSNPALREERSRDLELGAEWRPLDGLAATVAAFHRRIEGAIVWLPDFRFIWSPRNLPSALVRGVEVGAGWRWRSGWEMSAAYTYAPARFDFPGNENSLPYRPAHLGRAELAWERGPLRSALEARLTGRRYPNVAGTNALAGYVLVDWSAGWRRQLSNGELGLEVGVENVLDRDYDVVFGFPAAGRVLHLSLSYRMR